MARPSKLDPTRRKRLCAALRGGNFYDAACAYAGIGYRTFRTWMVRGAREGKGQYHDFREAVRAAVLEGERRVLRQWRKHCPTDARACRDLLARRHPEKWGPREKKEVTHKGGVRLVVEELVVREPDPVAVESNGRGSEVETVVE